MWRKLNREDLAKVNPLLPEEARHHFGFSWQVYKDYEILPLKGHERPSLEEEVEYIQAARQGTREEPECVKVYDPLIDTPYLFLDFARVAERKDNPYLALMDWISEYGLLGYTPRNPQYSKESTLVEEWVDSFTPPKRYDDKGGPWDTLYLIGAEAYQTNEALRLYEAALSYDEEKLEQAIFSEESPDWAAKRRKSLKNRGAATGASWVDVLVDEALTQTIEFTIHPIHNFAYPDIGFPPSFIGSGREGPLLTIEGMTRGWQVRNLVGAMHLQFYWLITSGGDISRCKHCNRIISYAPPIPGSDDRKPRRDKEFCDKRCRQNYHYHNRVKSQKPERS